MPRVRIGQGAADRAAIAVEVARLRDLDIMSLRQRWLAMFSEAPPKHVPRHLLIRMLAYRLQADSLSDLDGECLRMLDRSTTPEAAGRAAVAAGRSLTSLRPGTVLAREWNGHMHQVSVLNEGFAWNGHSFPSLSRVAQAITGTRWNGPRFFGLRDKPRGINGRRGQTAPRGPR